MLRKKWIYALVLAIACTAQTKAETLTENFDSWTSSVAEGWSLSPSATIGTSYGYTFEVNGDYKHGSSGKGIKANSTTAYLITPEVTGSVKFYYRASSSSSSYTCKMYVYEWDETSSAITGSALFTYNPGKGNGSTTWTQATINLTEGKRLAINLQNCYFDDFEGEIPVAVDGPALAVKDGTTKVNSPYTYSFGLTAAGTTHTFTLSNPGTEALNLSVSESGNFGAALSANSIEAKGEATLTLTMPEATSSSVVTLSSTNEGIEDFVINVNGTVKDQNKMFVDFADGQMPDGWTNVMIGSYGSGWEINNGYASHSNSASSYYYAALTSPKLTFTEGETLLFDVAKYGSSTYSTAMVKVQKSTDGTTWEDVYTTPDAEMVYGEWKTQSVSMPAGNYQIRFYGGYAHITNIYGGELPMEANMKVTAEDKNFGMVSEAQTYTFNIKNSGRSELTGISVESNNAAFTITDAPATLAAGADQDVTVTMSADTKGMSEGVITVKADGMDDVTFNVSGYVLDTDVIVVDFADNAVPEGWTNEGYTVSNNELSTAYNTVNLNSPAITVSEGQKLVIYAKGGSAYARLYVNTSTDDGKTWNTAKTFESELRKNTTDYVLLTVDNIAAGDYKLQFRGYYVTINTINGYNYNQNAPEMKLTPAEDAAFGTVTAEVSKTYTVENTGTGTLTVNIASDNEMFTVSPAELKVTTEAKEFTVTFTPADEQYGDFTANITVTPTYDETAAVIFAASAKVKNPNVWDEDFEDGTLPTGWEANNWTIGTFADYENTTKMALAPNSSTAGTLITPQLEAKENDVLTWDAYLNWYDEALIVEYSTDDKATWTEIYNYKTQNDSEAPSTTQRNYHKAMSFTAPADGKYYLRFKSTYQNGVDNFEGFKLVVKDHDASITAQNIPATGNEGVEYTATVTVKEMAGKAETVKAVLYFGEDVMAEAEESVEANGEVTLSLTFTPAEAMEAEAYIAVSYEDVALETEKTSVTIAAMPTLDEETGSLEGFENFSNYDNVKLKYNLKAGWNTIVLPFAVSDLSVFGEGAKAYSFNDYTDGNLNFKSETEMNAQQPYVLYATEAKKEIVFSDVKMFRTSTDATDIQTTKGDATFQGTYAGVEKFGNLEGNFYGVTTDGKIMKAGENASIKGFRAYFILPEGATARISMTFDDGAATGIEAIESLNSLTDGDVYDLQGRKVSRTQKGMYIVNGKKVVVK